MNDNYHSDYSLLNIIHNIRAVIGLLVLIAVAYILADYGLLPDWLGMLMVSVCGGYIYGNFWERFYKSIGKVNVEMDVKNEIQNPAWSVNSRSNDSGQTNQMKERY